MHDERQVGGDCIAVIGSVTQAMRAKSILAERGIRTEVIKVDSSVTGRGCAYGLMYSCALDETLRANLHAAGVRVRRG